MPRGRPSSHEHRWSAPSTDVEQRPGTVIDQRLRAARPDETGVLDLPSIGTGVPGDYGALLDELRNHVGLRGHGAPFLAADEQAAYQGWQHVNGYGDLSNFGRTVGIVGFSRTGRRVVDLLKCLEGVTCLVSDPYADRAEVEAAGAELVSLTEMLPRTDVLSLHAPALPDTHHLIGAAELALLPDHATVINTARGSLLDSAALAAECGSGRLFAILDVTEPEPLPADSPLRRLTGVMITPHVAGSQGTEIRRLTDHTLAELARWIAREPLRTEVTAEAMTLHA